MLSFLKQLGFLVNIVRGDKKKIDDNQLLSFAGSSGGGVSLSAITEMRVLFPDLLTRAK